MQRSAAQEATATGQPTSVTDAPRPRVSADSETRPGLEFVRHFTRPGVNPFEEIEWELRNAIIGNERGQVVFEQRDVEIPKFWSQERKSVV